MGAEPGKTMNSVKPDKQSFILGMITAFCECVAGGCKRLALSPPLSRDDYRDICDEAYALIEKHGLIHHHETNDDIPENARFEWILIAAKQETVDEYLELRKSGFSPVKSLEPFHKLLSYNEAESIHTGFDAYREYFMSEKMVEKAKELACVQFAGCTDKAGVDYFTGHLCSVAALVDTDEEKTVAFLHDILEDTDYPEEKLREEFGDEIVDAVCLLTHRERMDEAGYLEYICNLKASGNELAIAVKIADLTNNSDYTRLGVTCPEELQEKDRKRWKKYQKSQEILKGLE